MHVRPAQWTHRHTQRLFHLSFLMAWLIIISTLGAGLLLAYRQSHAQDIIATGNAAVGVTVPAIFPEPSLIDTQGGISVAPRTELQNFDDTKAQPQPKVPSSDNQPTLEIEPTGSTRDNATTGNARGGNGGVIQFTTQNPQFRGKSNVPNGIVYLEIHSVLVIRGTTFTKSDGTWDWQSPEPVSPGVHKLFVTIQDSTNSAISYSGSLDFSVALDAKKLVEQPAMGRSIATGVDSTLFDVLVKIPLQFRSVPAGNEIIASIKLINFGSPGKAVDVEVQYLIEDEAGGEIMQSSETVAVATQLALLKSFRLSPLVKPGQYQLIVRVPSQNLIATASDKFEVITATPAATGTTAVVNYTILFQGLGMLIFFFMFVAYFEYNKVSALSRFIKQVSEADLKAQM